MHFVDWFLSFANGMIDSLKTGGLLAGEEGERTRKTSMLRKEWNDKKQIKNENRERCFESTYFLLSLYKFFYKLFFEQYINFRKFSVVFLILEFFSRQYFWMNYARKESENLLLFDSLYFNLSIY